MQFSLQTDSIRRLAAITPRKALKDTFRWWLGKVPISRAGLEGPRRNLLASYKLRALTQKLMDASGEMVYAGPFAAMRISPDLFISHEPKMIIGSYEEELHGVVNEVICAAPENIINIGSSLGYYTVGFASKIANTFVTAFETQKDPCWRQAALLAELNGVSHKILQRGSCTAEELHHACLPGSFVLCDCEGAEVDLLDPAIVPALRTSKMVVEVHEFYRKDALACLVSRFRNSHRIRIVEETVRDADRYRVLRALPKRWRNVAIQEARWIPGNRAGTILTSIRFLVLDPIPAE
jgi:hypothetical protein